MLAVRHTRYGPPELLEVRNVPIPEPGEGRVLVKVRAASVNAADLDGILARPAFIRLVFGLRRPRDPSLGVDLAGEVVALGPGTSRFKVGDAVFGDMFAGGSGAGSFAEYVAVRETALLPKPDWLSFEDASTLPHSAVLAVQGLRDRSGTTIGPGGKVLINGASGNVGPFAIQIAKILGAEVTATARTEKLEFVHSLGADHVVDFTRQDPARSGTYDLILDVTARRSVLRWRRALTPNGRYVTLGGSTRLIVDGMLGALLSKLSRRKSELMLWWKPFRREDVDYVLGLVREGRLKPVIDRRFPLAEVPAALRYLLDGKARGKLVITYPEESRNPG